MTGYLPTMESTLLFSGVLNLVSQRDQFEFQIRWINL